MFCFGTSILEVMSDFDDTSLFWFTQDVAKHTRDKQKSNTVLMELIFKVS